MGAESKGISHVTLIEEAHRLFASANAQNSMDAVSSKAKAINVFTDMLAEMRALGEGIIIAEQIPTKLAIDIIKHPDLKIMHRITADDDRRILGSAMNFSESHRRYAATIKRGWAAVYVEGLYTPVLVHVVPLEDDLKDDLEDDPPPMPKRAPSGKDIFDEMIICKLAQMILRGMDYYKYVQKTYLAMLKHKSRNEAIDYFQNLVRCLSQSYPNLEDKCKHLIDEMEKEREE
jgi:hypothetical protein